MEKHKLQPLTKSEKRDAEKYHNLIYHFLHRKGYSVDDFYDIAVIGYLKGIQDYHRKEALQVWSISTICEHCMNNEVGNYFQALNTKKRKPSGGFVSLDATFGDGKETFTNVIMTPTLEDEYFEKYVRENDGDRIKEILAPLTDIQRKIVILMASGKTLDFISKRVHLSKIAINREIKTLRAEISNYGNTKEPTIKSETVQDITEYIGVPTEIILTLKLSTRQLDVINLLMVGYKESDIGRELGLSRQAVYDAVKKVRLKAKKSLAIV